MKILVTGAAGFLGSYIVEQLRTSFPESILIGIDNLSRRGSESNVGRLERLKCKLIIGDIALKDHLDSVEKVDWVIDCAANPSVTAGLKTDTLKLIQDNLIGTVNVLEKCKRDNAGLILISTSRVYSVDALNMFSVERNNNGNFKIVSKKEGTILGLSNKGISEQFSTTPPVSIYGATKLASEILALEYYNSFNFPVFINRCGVIAGAGQFGKIDQGIFSFWIYQYLLSKPLSFIGFDGKGSQVRDMVHPIDVFKLVRMQIESVWNNVGLIVNIGGGIENAISLNELDEFCKLNIDESKIVGSVQENRPFDIPVFITDYSLANDLWGWSPSFTSDEILHEILDFGKNNINWLISIS